MCITDVLTDVEKALFHLAVGSVQDKEFVTVLTMAGGFFCLNRCNRLILHLLEDAVN